MLLLARTPYRSIEFNDVITKAALNDLWRLEKRKWEKIYDPRINPFKYETAFSRITGNAQAVFSNTNPAAAVTPGATNRIILVTGGSDTTTNTATIGDTASNTWNQLNAKITQSGSGMSYSWWALANGTGSTTVTFTITGTHGFGTILIDVFSGNDTASPISNQSTAVGASSPSGSITPNDANCLIYCGTVDNVTAVGTIGGSAASKGADDGANDWSIYREISGGSGSSQTCTPTASGAFTMHMGAIKPPASVASYYPVKSWRVIN